MIQQKIGAELNIFFGKFLLVEINGLDPFNFL